MAEATVNEGKRRFLVGATSVVGGIGAVAVATPFVMSLFPSERAKAAGAPVEVDISKLEPGQKIDVEWRGKVVWVINRTNPMLASLPKLDPKLADPNSNQSQQPGDCKNEHRSIKDNVLVMIGICTHLGCSPTYRPEIGPADLGPDWLGRVLLSVSPEQVRPRGPRLLRRAGADEPPGAAAQVRDRHQDHHRRTDEVGLREPRPCKSS